MTLRQYKSNQRTQNVRQCEKKCECFQNINIGHPKRLRHGVTNDWIASFSVFEARKPSVFTASHQLTLRSNPHRMNKEKLAIPVQQIAKSFYTYPAVTLSVYGEDTRYLHVWGQFISEAIMQTNTKVDGLLSVLYRTYIYRCNTNIIFYR